MKEKGTQFQQLTMFEPLTKLRYQMSPGDYNPRSSDSEGQFWDRKVEESKNRDTYSGHLFGHDSPSLYDRIERSGIHTPVRLVSPYTPISERYGDGENPMIVNGHHRIAAAADIANKRMDWNVEVPVEWNVGNTDDTEHMFKLTPKEERDWKS